MPRNLKQDVEALKQQHEAFQATLRKDLGTLFNVRVEEVRNHSMTETEETGELRVGETWYKFRVTDEEKELTQMRLQGQ